MSSRPGPLQSGLAAAVNATVAAASSVAAQSSSIASNLAAALPAAAAAAMPSRLFGRRLSSSGMSAAATWSTASSANTSPTPTPGPSVPSSPRESPTGPRRSAAGMSAAALQLQADDEDARMAYLRSKLTRLGQPMDTVAVSADMEIPRQILKRRGAISLEAPSELMQIAQDNNAKRARLLPPSLSDRVLL